MKRTMPFGLILSVAAALAASGPVGAAAGPGSIRSRLAGPWYTPQELRALIAYSNASPAQKQAILAGTGPAVTSSAGFHWADAGVGAAIAAGVFLVGGFGVRGTKTRSSRAGASNLVTKEER